MKVVHILKDGRRVESIEGIKVNVPVKLLQRSSSERKGEPNDKAI